MDRKIPFAKFKEPTNLPMRLPGLTLIMRISLMDMRP